MKHSTKLISIATSTALAATLGLAGCATSQPATDAAAAESTTSADAAASSTETAGVVQTGIADFSSDDEAWIGMSGEDNMVYFVEDAATGQAAFMVYYTAENSFERYVGAETRDGNKVTIADNLSGKTVDLELSGPDSDGILTITFEGSAPATLSVTPSFDDVKGTFDEVGGYASERK